MSQERHADLRTGRHLNDGHGARKRRQPFSKRTRTFTVHLSNARTPTIGDADGTGTITNDDDGTGPYD